MFTDWYQVFNNMDPGEKGRLLDVGGREAMPKSLWVERILLSSQEPTLVVVKDRELHGSISGSCLNPGRMPSAKQNTKVDVKQAFIEHL